MTRFTHASPYFFHPQNLILTRIQPSRDELPRTSCRLLPPLPSPLFPSRAQASCPDVPRSLRCRPQFSPLPSPVPSPAVLSFFPRCRLLFLVGSQLPSSSSLSPSSTTRNADEQENRTAIRTPKQPQTERSFHGKIQRHFSRPTVSSAAIRHVVLHVCVDGCQPSKVNVFPTALRFEHPLKHIHLFLLVLGAPWPSHRYMYIDEYIATDGVRASERAPGLS